jgi:hypothetical protein
MLGDEWRVHREAHPIQIRFQCECCGGVPALYRPKTKRLSCALFMLHHRISLGTAKPESTCAISVSKWMRRWKWRSRRSLTSCAGERLQGCLPARGGRAVSLNAQRLQRYRTSCEPPVAGAKGKRIARRLQDRFGDGERPTAVEDLLAGAIQADHVVPTLGDR